MRDKESLGIYEMSVNGRLYYCSGKENWGSVREGSSVDSEKIEKGAIKVYLIYSMES
jgi:hypothetical protein